MNYKDLGFRPFYKNFSILLNNDNIMDIVSDLDVDEAFDGVLVYGYVDHEAGFTFEILSLALQGDEGGFKFYDLPNDITYKLRADAVKDCECLFSEEVFEEYMELFKDKISSLEIYEENENVAKSRRFDFLDPFRHEECIDDVQVVLLKDGLQPEQVWVRIEDLGDKVIIGKLLNEPDQDFGYHLYDKVAFFVYTDEDGNQHLLCDMDPCVKLRAEDLADGRMLCNAIDVFARETTQEHFIDILELVRDSYIWIPCNTILGQLDEKALLKMADEADNLDDMVGTTFTSQQDIRLMPDLMKMDDKIYFPVFTSVEEMGDAAKNHSQLQKHFLEAIKMACACEEDVAGILINPFSSGMVIEKKVWNIVENMKSRIVEDDE